MERPASVVKELLENSLDAGAGRVEVQVESGGRKRIRITDDGCGMDPDDALQAFERHATSKIRRVEDLLAIGTLGFRGEALPSIAAVSRLNLETKMATEATGTRVEIWGGEIRDVRESARAVGTEVEVRDLFFNVAVRRKFLKSESTELGHIASLVTHYAIAHPDKSFLLKTATRTLVDVSAVRERRERVFQLLGSQLLEQLIEIPPVERRIFDSRSPAGETDEPGEEPSPGLIQLSGFVSRPEVQRLNRKQIFIFVNGRLVRNRLLLHAVNQAYRNIFPSGMFPVALVFLVVPATEVDVNVHPAKMEVRFRRTNFIHEFTHDAIRQTLVAARPIAHFPVKKSSSAFPPRGVRPDASRLAKPARHNREPAGSFHLTSPADPSASARLPLEAAAALSVYSPCQEIPETGASGETSGSATGSLSPSSLEEEAPEGLNPLGQVQDSFIVAENQTGLWIIDQHVAHERILFEQHLAKRLQNQVESQRLLLPIIVELTPRQQARFQDIASELQASGFEIEPFGRNTVAVKAVPAEVSADRVEKLLMEILGGVEEKDPEGEISLENLRNKIAASVACHAAIKVNMPLEKEKMEWLLRELLKTECPMSCPHGRPIILRYTLRDIRKAFKRT